MSDHDTPEVGSGNDAMLGGRDEHTHGGFICLDPDDCAMPGDSTRDRLAAVEAEHGRHRELWAGWLGDAAARAESAEAERDTALREVAEWRAATGEPDADHARLSMDDLAATADTALAGVAERDARLAKVEALADEWSRDGEHVGSTPAPHDYARDLRAALANPDGGGQ